MEQNLRRIDFVYLIQNQLVMRILLLFLLIVTISFSSIGQSKSECPPEDAGKQLIQNNRMKAMYLYQFSSNVSYKEVQGKEINDFAFLGSDSVKVLFDHLIVTKVKKKDRIKTTIISDLSEVANHQVVFIDCHVEIDEKALQKATLNSNALIITDHASTIKGMINFKIHNCKVQYELNKKLLKRSTFKINTELEQEALSSL